MSLELHKNTRVPRVVVRLTNVVSTSTDSAIVACIERPHNWSTINHPGFATEITYGYVRGAGTYVVFRGEI